MSEDEVADTREKPDSVAPHLAALARSRRVRICLVSLAKWMFPAIFGSLILPSFHWATSRYGRVEAEALTRRVSMVERVAGLPPLEVAGKEAALRDRVRELEERLGVSEQATLEREHALYRRMLRAHFRGRPAAAKVALDVFERDCRCLGEVGSKANPYRCAARPGQSADVLLSGAR